MQFDYFLLFFIYFSGPIWLNSNLQSTIILHESTQHHHLTWLRRNPYLSNSAKTSILFEPNDFNIQELAEHVVQEPVEHVVQEPVELVEPPIPERVEHVVQEPVELVEPMESIIPELIEPMEPVFKELVEYQNPELTELPIPEPIEPPISELMELPIPEPIEPLIPELVELAISNKCQGAAILILLLFVFMCLLFVKSRNSNRIILDIESI